MLLASFEFELVCIVAVFAISVIAIVIRSASKDKARVETMKKLREDDSLEMCSECDGVGVKGMSEKTCETCKGRGYVKCFPEDERLDRETQKKLHEDDSLEMCTKCNGTGTTGWGNACKVCKGRGYIKSPTPSARLVQAIEPEDDPVE